MTHSENREVFGSGLLNTIVILGSVALLVASITGPQLKAAVQPHAATQFSEQANTGANQS